MTAYTVKSTVLPEEATNNIITMSTSESTSQHPIAPILYPSPAATSLQLKFIGQHVSNVPTPAAIIDAAVVRRNCKLMLEATEKLGVAFRAHVKTHKVVIVTYMSHGRC